MWGFWIICLIGVGIIGISIAGFCFCNYLQYQSNNLKFINKLDTVQNITIGVFCVSIILTTAIFLSILLISALNGAEYRQYVQLYELMQSMNVTSENPYAWQAIKFNEWLAEAKISREMWGNFSQWYPWNFDSLNFIVIK